MKTKVQTTMKNDSLKIVLSQKREIKIGDKLMANCSYQEIKTEAAKFGKVIGKTLPELKAQIIKGNNLQQGNKTTNVNDGSLQGAEIVKSLDQKDTSRKEETKKEEQKTTSDSQAMATLIKAEMPYTTKIYLLHTIHKMDAKQATEALGLKGSTAYGKKAIAAHVKSDKLKKRAAKYLKA